MSDCLLVCLNGGLVVLIWLVQLIIYPAMVHWPLPSFCAIHRWYTSRISLLVIPLMSGQALLVGYGLVTNFSALLLVQASLVAIAWGLTFFLFVPLHARLSRGYDIAVIRRLVAANWFRTILWSAVSGLDIARVYLA
ncbi:MAG: hypothetical protein N839_0013065 [Desulfofustis sp. PB-SRB1]|jgi:hypothetical protein|nr:hypothetical protein [Desulfofustis sp. PB-SRB1]MBM1003329.1 hypothetical protein [Desulfofustis sp. PB-SRB1]HBH27625.1 hypothetical protein [Desulfofustis sp.]HBH30882.1 hypothetical protein [Desulfofustis sp.]